MIVNSLLEIYYCKLITTNSLLQIHHTKILLNLLRFPENSCIILIA